MSRSKSSKNWLRQHFRDEYVIRAQSEGQRSRAVYKLSEIQEKYQLIKKGDTVVDLGAAPGGWSEVAKKWVGATGRVIAMDILAMEAIPDVSFIQGDFREQAVLDEVITALDGDAVNLVISDMAPNLSGMASVDLPKAMYLVELALCFAQENLHEGGHFICKIFQGEGSEQLLRQVKANFKKVSIRKPKASRQNSREVYIVAQSYHG